MLKIIVNVYVLCECVCVHVCVRVCMCMCVLGIGIGKLPETLVTSVQLPKRCSRLSDMFGEINGKDGWAGEGAVSEGRSWYRAPVCSSPSQCQ